MSNEAMQVFLDDLNDNSFENYIFIKKINKNVFYGKVWYDTKDFPSIKSQMAFDDIFFIQNESKRFVGGVQLAGQSLFYYVSEKYRKKGYLTKALRNLILPYIFYELDIDFLCGDIVAGDKEYNKTPYHNSLNVAQNCGFKFENGNEGKMVLAKQNIQKVEF